MPYIFSEMAESIGTITLDHDHRRNALSRALVEEVVAALRSFCEAKVRVAILRAKPDSRVGQPVTRSTSSRPRGATRWAGTIRCASSCARSKPSRRP